LLRLAILLLVAQVAPAPDRTSDFPNFPLTKLRFSEILCP